VSLITSNLGDLAQLSQGYNNFVQELIVSQLRNRGLEYLNLSLDFDDTLTPRRQGIVAVLRIEIAILVDFAENFGREGPG
jgi:hypothetical protein